MVSTLDALVCGIAAALLWTCIGLPLARRVVPGALALPVAPALGWAVHSAAALPVFFLIGFTKETLLGVTGAALIAAFFALVLQLGPDEAEQPARVPIWAFAIAALLACGPAAAILPKLTGDGVALAAPIFDHAKVAMIDEMVRLGVPPGNPFFGEPGEPTRLVYYYLWHFSAAEVALLTGSSGWAADAGLTWFTAFASLVLMMGVACWLGGRVSAGLWVLPLSFAGSLRPVLALAFGGDTVNSLIRPATGFGGWLFQSTWAPQHLASVSCVVIAVLLMSEMMRRRGPLLLVTLALVVAAGFESSAWVGGVTFALIAVVVGLLLLILAAPTQRMPFLENGGIAALLALALAAPLLRDQFTAMPIADGAWPIVVRHYPVLGPLVPENLRHWLDLPAYWLVQLPLEFPAIYPAALAVMAATIVSRNLDPERGPAARALAAMAIACLAVAWLLVDTIANNNDLAWRAALAGAVVLTIFAAVGLSTWLAAPRRIVAAAAIGVLVAGLFEGGQLVLENFTGRLGSFSKVFASTPEMWEAVRKHSDPDERIANNPLFLQDATPWPVNLSWALLSDRRSCFAGRELALVYAPLSPERREEINAQFIRVFRGEGSADDIHDLAVQFGCRLVVVTAQDGAWTHDPFAASPYYRLVDSKADAWRIYKGSVVGIAHRLTPWRDAKYRYTN
jgi:hypothetical protein